MGKRNPVTLVSAVVKRNNAVVIGNLCEANIPPTTISPPPIATRVIMTCKIVKAPTDIPRIMESSRCWPTRRKLKSVPPWLQLQQGFAADGMGSGVGLRGINPAPPDVSYGSESVIPDRLGQVRQSPESGSRAPTWTRRKRVPKADSCSAANIRQGLSRGQFRVLACRVPF